MKISVFGLGYVGVVTVACLAQAGHQLVGVDIHPDKVHALARGESPIVEPGVAELLSSGARAGLISGTCDSSQAVLDTDYSIVCVGTPSSSNGMPELGPVRKVCEELALGIARKKTRHIVVLRSTVLPESTQSLARDYFSDLLAEGRMELYFYPEFLREGSAISDFLDPSLRVVGCSSGDCDIENIRFLFQGQPEVVEWSTAELLKYACNAWHATKVAFANEIGRLGKAGDIDSFRVMQLLCQDTRLNLSEYYMKPGNPFGGSCLPKDVLAVSQMGRQKGIFLPLLENILESNRRHSEMLLRQVVNAGKREVVILGLAFKINSDDLRESAMVHLAQTLLGQGYTIRIYDPHLELDRLMGTNKEQIEGRMPHLAAVLCPTLEAAVGESGTIVAAQRVASIEQLKPLVTPLHSILDVNGWQELATLACPYSGFCW